MTAPNKCPKCGLLNEPDARACDCGFDFVTRQMPLAPKRSLSVAELKSTRNWAVIGGVIAVLMQLTRSPQVEARLVLPTWFGWVAAAGAFAVAIALSMKLAKRS